MSKVDLHIGTLDDMGKRFVDAWHRAEQGEEVDEVHITFPDLESLLEALTPKRLDLLRLVHREPQKSVKALAERLARDYKRVHEDVVILESSGLISRDSHGVRVPYDVMKAELRL